MRKIRVKILREKAMIVFLALRRKGQEARSFKNVFRHIKRLYLRGEVY